MINQESVKAVASAISKEGFVWPLYESYCFSRIPGTIYSLLTGEDSGRELPKGTIVDCKPKQILSLFIDSFGWKFFDYFCEELPLLSRFVKQGVVSKLTSQFPSTTAVHVTTMNTGKTLGEHGVCEWYYYEPLVGEVINPLLFNYGGETNRNTLVSHGYTGQLILPTETIHQKLLARGLRSVCLIPADYLPSQYNATLNNGAETVGYSGIEDGMSKATLALAMNSVSHAYLYYGNIDTVAHKFGPFSEPHIAECRAVFQALENGIDSLLKRVPEILILLFADHGQILIPPENNFYLDREVPQLIPLMKTTIPGNAIAPGGSLRNYFAYIKEAELEHAQSLLGEKLAGKAEVYTLEQLISKGVFGSVVTDRFKERAGNIIIVPYPNHGVWWSGNGKYEAKYLGKHGGASPDEMEIALMSLAN